MTKLESYMLNGTFSVNQFYSDVEGHPEEPDLKRALEELAFFSEPNSVKILGVYPASPFRQTMGRVADLHTPAVRKNLVIARYHPAHEGGPLFVMDAHQL
jgi:hypothetical protein